MAKKIDSSIPSEFHEQWKAIGLIFLEPFTSFMKEVRGPAYKPPRFEHIDLSEKKKDTPFAVISQHDIIDMTQPSQLLSQSQTEESSCSRPEKIEVRRQKDGKWQINKALGVDKMNDIKQN